MSATWSRGRPPAGAAALKAAFCSPKKSPKMNTASTTAIATTPHFSQRSGAPPASRRPAVTTEPTISASRAARPSASSGAARAAASSGSTARASQGRAP